ncbi:hypothetical protein BH23CHL6_BH23CHL6_03740 [soil metagenome]
MVSGADRLGRRLASEAHVLSGLLVALGALALYGRTLLPVLGLWDTAEFQTLGPVLGIAHPTGFPSYTLLAWVGSVVLQPVGEPAFRANLLSALLAAGAAGLTAGLVARLTGRTVIGIAAGTALAVAPATWAVGLRADAHALHLFLAVLLLILLVGWSRRLAEGRAADRWLIAAAVTYGVALGNHALTILLAPGIAAFVLLVQPRLPWQRPRLVLSCSAALAATTVCLYAYLPLRSAMDPPLDYANPETLEGFRYLVFAEQFRGTFQDFPALDVALMTIGRATLEQLGLLAVLGAVGLVAALVRWPAMAALLALWFGVTWAFALGYLNAGIERYYLVPMLAAVVLGGYGAGAVRELVARRIDGQRAPSAESRPRRQGAAVAVAAVVAAALLIGPSLAAVPARFDDLDSSREVDGREWVEAVLPRLEANAVVVSWWSYSTPLWYAQFVEGRRLDVYVVDDRTILDQELGDAGAAVERYLDERPVYLVRQAHEVGELEERFVLSRVPGIRESPVYRVDGRR